jgi:hypothetical protein
MSELSTTPAAPKGATAKRSPSTKAPAKGAAPARGKRAAPATAGAGGKRAAPAKAAARTRGKRAVPAKRAVALDAAGSVKRAAPVKRPGAGRGRPAAGRSQPRAGRSRPVAVPVATEVAVRPGEVMPAPAAAAKPRRVHVRKEHLPEQQPSVRLPVVGLVLPVPAKEELPFILGIGAIAALNLIDWPIAVIVAVGHTIATHSRNQALRELAEGIESGV